MPCPIAQCLGVVGERWTLLVLREAFFRVRRFDDFQRRLGIARNILADRLSTLVDAGVLERRPYQDRPVRHEYRLTQKGLDLWPVLVALQAHVLSLGSRLVKPGGTLVYAVCSLIEDEGAARIADFLESEQDWFADDLGSLPGQAVGQGKRLSPAHDGTDGFFIARLARRC